MTIHATFNPIGSTSPKDLIDNAQNLDYLILGPATLYPDRRGVNRLSWAGIEASFAAAQAQRTAVFNAAQDLQAQQFEMAQDARVSEFNQFLNSSGYEVPIDYAPGLSITRSTQIVRYLGDLYRPKDSALPFTTTTFEADAFKWIANGDNSLRQDLFAGNGEMIGVQSPLAGAIQSSLALLSRNWSDIRAVFGAIGDGNYHPLSERFGSLAEAQLHYSNVPITSLTQSIDWAATEAPLQSGLTAWAPKGEYVWTDGINPQSAGGVVGDGAGNWVSGFNHLFYGNGGTIFYLYGTGAKKFEVRHVSASALTGGSRANPSASAAHYIAANTPADVYEVIDLTEQNAVGATPATTKKFSVAINMPSGGNVRLEHFRVLPWFDRAAGYIDPMETGLGDEWDVGLLIRSSGNNYINNVQVVGYWRIASLLKASISESWDAPRNNESDYFNRCKFQGHTGGAVRSYDVHKIAAKTLNTISIPWYSAHTFSSDSMLVCGAGQFKYSNVTYDAVNAYLVFTVEGSTASVTVGGWLTEYGTTFGTSGTVFMDCQFSDLAHSSRMCSTNTNLDSPFPRMGKALEIGGEQTRAIQFTNCTLTAKDDILVFMTRCKDALFTGGYFEGAQAYGAPGSGNVLPAGGRWIATQVGGTVPDLGGTENLRLDVGTITQMVDMRPFAGTSSTNRFTVGGDTGLFRPESAVSDSYSSPESRHGNVTRRSTGNMGFVCGPTNPETGAPGAFSFTRNGGGDVTFYGRSPNFDIGGTTRVRLCSVTGDGVTKVVGFVADGGAIYPSTDGDKDLGLTTARYDEAFINRLRITTATIISGNGSPEGLVTAGVGSIYMRTNGGVGSTTYYKSSGTGNIGWTAVA